ncbi:hypothetical protein B0H17DRAFT_404279 [Mycena rosella]|uniref:Uncharacterized protein n=1 Tax=Mycena rosella TaxID=1033263 RepID=A0AAD7CLY4_MYCRO|nr:hypothetical protein B0H17DRAFT_404279 [Mycena rosella]
MEPAERERAWVLRSNPLGVNTTTRYMYTARPKAFLILIGLVLFGFVAPAVLESSPVAAAGPAGAAFAWSGAKFMQGLTTLALIRMVFSLRSLACDAQGWFTSATEHAPTPAELEDGTAQCPHGVEPAWTTATEDPILKVARTAATFIFVCFQLFRGDVVSGQNPLLENVGAVLLFLLRGLEVILVEGLLLVFVLWLKGITREVFRRRWLQPSKRGYDLLRQALRLLKACSIQKRCRRRMRKVRCRRRQREPRVSSEIYASGLTRRLFPARKCGG